MPLNHVIPHNYHDKQALRNMGLRSMAPLSSLMHTTYKVERLKVSSTKRMIHSLGTLNIKFVELTTNMLIIDKFI